MSVRTAGVVLALCLTLGAGAAWARPVPGVRAWVSTVVDRIVRADRPGASSPGGTVTIRLRITADGDLDGVEVEGSSGSPTLDARALRAATAAGPFPAPPARLLTLEGVTELSFGLALKGARPR